MITCFSVGLKVRLATFDPDFEKELINKTFKQLEIGGRSWFKYMNLLMSYEG